MNGMFHSINTAASGLTAQRLRMDVISNNIANVNTTRTTDGGPFRRDRIILRQVDEKIDYRLPFLPDKFKPTIGNGVKVVRIEQDNSPFRLVYDPEHPDAYKTGPKAGYVEYPNVNIVTEMVDMISASRSYEANVQVINNAKSMFMKALEIGRA